MKEVNRPSTASTGTQTDKEEIPVIDLYLNMFGVSISWMRR